MRAARLLAPLAVAVLAAGCASVGRVLPETVRKVAIVRLQNLTEQGALPAMFDEDIRTAFRLDGRLTVVEDPAAADAVLEGTIVSYTRQPSRFSGNNIVQEYLSHAAVELSLTARPGSESLWIDRRAAPPAGATAYAGSMAPRGSAVRRIEAGTHFTVVPASGLPVETEEDAQKRIVREIADQAVLRVLEGW